MEGFKDSCNTMIPSSMVSTKNPEIVYEKESRSRPITTTSECVSFLKIPEGCCPIFDKKKWKVVRIDSLDTKDIEVLETTARTLAKFCGKSLNFHSCLFAAERINAVWTNLRMRQDSLGIVVDDDQIIRFSSTHASVGWLSNFFHTLVPDHEQEKLFPSLEHAYMSIMAIQKGCPSTAISDWHWNHSAKEIKRQAANLFKQFPPAADNNEEYKIAVMRRLIHAKFQCNSALSTLLQETTSHELREYTNDAFWGTQFDQVLTDQSNQLGKILMSERRNL
jgi:predicted NAD-dependent protein-ADP-ribosyltransferase YbiA (DUF1768 family)